MTNPQHSLEALQLLQDGSVALAEVEGNGIKIDLDYLERAITKTESKIARIKRSIEESEVMDAWRKTYGQRTKLSSRSQLGHVLFEVLGFEDVGRTATGGYSTTEDSLSRVDHQFVRQYLRLRKYEKAVGTYLKNLQREAVNGIVRPFFNLHIVRTYRSSSDSPNFQNIPSRNPRMAQLIRRCFVARPGRVLVEIDYSSIEVRISACYHRDPAMIHYLSDSTTDMHRDSAMDCFLLPRTEVTKQIRYVAKNKFVFPQFYGDWYIDCARNLWNDIEKLGLRTASGIPLKKHLVSKGIRELGDLDPKQTRPGHFDHHIRQIEKQFWRKKFPVYARWKRDWYASYQRTGWFRTLTGFVCQGFMARNDVLNYGVQGTAFHCLLWSLIQLVRSIRRKGMETLVVGQIHDSIVADVPVAELDDYLRLAKRIMIQRLRKHWDWIVVPIEIEAEVTPEGGSWAEKEEVEIP